VFPALKMRRRLPEGKPVTIELGPLTAGRYEFRCGMDMIRGAVVVQAKP
jgi:plastocyanin domain-containing protein